MSTRIAIDVGIVVNNLERSLSFYHDLVGLSVVAEVATSLIGKGKMVQLKHRESLLKLVQLDKAPSEPLKGLAAALGYRYITLLVSDLVAIVTQLERHQVPITVPITQLGNGAAIAMIEDPDGNIVEFVQEAIPDQPTPSTL